jgi:L-lactate dehydrogenase complex protein LldF
MSETAEKFAAKSTVKAADIDHRRKINFNISKYNAVVPQGKKQFIDVEAVRMKAKNIKWRAIENLDRNLEDFEKHFSQRGGKVIWAETVEDARQAIGESAEENIVQLLSKNMATEKFISTLLESELVLKPAR